LAVGRDRPKSAPGFAGPHAGRRREEILVKLGFVSAILKDFSFRDVMDYAGSHGFECVEAACWPGGKAERRYAGVTHIDVESFGPEKADAVKKLCRETGVGIAALAYYPNMLDPDPEKRAYFIEHLKKVIAAAEKLGVRTVTSFIGRVSSLSVEENFPIFERVWKPIIEFAERSGVRIAIENCPMLFTDDEWPGGQNLATSPAVWRRMFEAIPSKNFGLAFDPSHFVWQRMDYIKPVYEFRDRIFHVHCKDIKIHRDRLDDVGIMATPLQYMSPKLPGLGDVNWGRFLSALTDVGYNGNVCIEIEDRAFEGSEKAVLDSLELSRRYIRNFVI
jgi:sugar phosphate isomerase/epimerase